MKRNDLGWKVLLVSMPLLIVFVSFFYGLPIQTGFTDSLLNVIVLCFMLYVGVCAGFFVFCLIRLSILSALAFFLSPALCIAVLTGPITAKLHRFAFRSYIYPAANYVEKSCHPSNFIENGRVYQVGFCYTHVSSFGDNVNFDIILYDTSGDIQNDYEPSRQHGIDDTEWVAAIRKQEYRTDFSGFEVQRYFASRIFGSFYTVQFDESDMYGFVKEYGKSSQVLE